MNKEKQIEEMYQEFLQHKHDTMCKVFSYKGMCENFINLGYRKINENEVVISKEEYEEMTKLKEENKDLNEEIDTFNHLCNEWVKINNQHVKENQQLEVENEKLKNQLENKVKEMASDMDYACTKHDLWPEDAKEIARVLRTLGYRKCPDDCIREVRKETATDWCKIIIGRLKELWIGRVLTTNDYNALVDYFDKVLKLYDDNKIKNNSRCHKCVYEMNCSKDKDNNRQCPDYKKDSPDGGYYG